MRKVKDKKQIKPGQIWVVPNGVRGFYITAKCDKNHWFGTYVEKISDKKFVEADYDGQFKTVKHKDQKIPIRAKNLLNIFRLEEDAELVEASK